MSSANCLFFYLYSDLELVQRADVLHQHCNDEFMGDALQSTEQSTSDFMLCQRVNDLKQTEIFMCVCMCVCLCTLLSVKDDRTCVYMSDWSMTAWVLTGRFWAALPRLGPDSIAYEHKHHSVQTLQVLK